MFGLGVGEVVLVLGLVVLFFGGRKIPELARGLGTGIRNFKRGLNEGQAEDEKQLPPGAEEGEDTGS